MSTGTATLPDRTDVSAHLIVQEFNNPREFTRDVVGHEHELDPARFHVAVDLTPEFLWIGLSKKFGQQLVGVPARLRYCCRKGFGNAPALPVDGAVCGIVEHLPNDLAP